MAAAVELGLPPLPGPPEADGELLSRVPDGECEGVRDLESDAGERGEMALECEEEEEW